MKVAHSQRTGRGSRGTDKGLTVLSSTQQLPLIDALLRQRHRQPVRHIAQVARRAKRKILGDEEICFMEREWRRGSGSNRRIKVLQTSPLPLGYRALRVLPRLPPGKSGTEVPVGKGLIGAGDRGRTGDIFLGKEALYH